MNIVCNLYKKLLRPSAQKGLHEYPLAFGAKEEGRLKDGTHAEDSCVP